jgi:predicted transcriptional regulator
MSAALALDALGHHTRRDIVDLLARRPRSVTDLAEELPVSRPAVSQHLRVLEQASLVTHHRDGTRRVYRIDPTGFISARGWLEQFWMTALERFAVLAEQSAPHEETSR